MPFFANILPLPPISAGSGIFYAMIQEPADRMGDDEDEERKLRDKGEGSPYV